MLQGSLGCCWVEAGRGVRAGEQPEGHSLEPPRDAGDYSVAVTVEAGEVVPFCCTLNMQQNYLLTDEFWIVKEGEELRKTLKCLA